MREHLTEPRWLYTSEGEPRGYVPWQGLAELWFHTGTNCNLACPFCLEGSRPGDRRVEFLLPEDVERFVREALPLGVKRFAFTGGEPFVNPGFDRMVEFALRHRPVLILSNGTTPLRRKLPWLRTLSAAANPLSIRISLDYPDEARHDAGRGRGSFALALDSLRRLYEAGIDVSVACLRQRGQSEQELAAAFAPVFTQVGLPPDLPLVSFPDFLPPGASADVPEVTKQCVQRHLPPERQKQLMCSYLRMVLRKNGQVRVYACTLVDDDPDFDLGDSLRAAVDVRVRMKHHRCYCCFAYGACCSGNSRTASVENGR